MPHRILAALCFMVASNLVGTVPPLVEMVDTLEWMIWDCDLIVLGHPRSVTPDVIQTSDSVFEEQAVVDVTRVLLGSYTADSLTFHWKTTRAMSMKREVDLAREPNVKYHRPQLFFLRRSGEQGIHEPAHWTLRRNIFLNQSSQGLATARGGLARTADEILGLIELEVAHRAANRLPVDIDPVPGSFHRTKTLAQGCFSCIAPKGAVILKLSPTKYVVAPAFPQFHIDALTLLQSPDYRERERGALMLRSYPGEATTRVLLPLLTDDGAYRWDLSSNTVCAAYVVRAAAYDILREHGIRVPEPFLGECRSR